MAACYPDNSFTYRLRVIFWKTRDIINTPVRTSKLEKIFCPISKQKSFFFLRVTSRDSPIQNTYVYSLNFADYQVLLAQDHDDMEYMTRKLKEEYEKWGLAVNLEKN